MQPDVFCVVPARLGSSRFPRKLLEPLFGKPVVVHALERAAESGCFSGLACFTDSEEIAARVAAHGFRAVLTGHAENGTERIARHLHGLPAGLVVNLQGDEPAFPAEGLIRLCAGLRAEPESVHTLVEAESPTEAEWANPNRVKAALDNHGMVIDFFRGASPPKSPAPSTVRLHLGAYGYPVGYLRRYAALPPSTREQTESHEMLRDLSLAPIRAHASPPGSPVDVPADLEIARKRLEALLSPQGVLS